MYRLMRWSAPHARRSDTTLGASTELSGLRDKAVQRAADAKGAIWQELDAGLADYVQEFAARRLTNEDDLQMAEVSAERFSDDWDSALDGESLFEIYASAATETGTSPLSDRNSSLSATLACSGGIIRSAIEFPGC